MRATCGAPHKLSSNESGIGNRTFKREPEAVIDAEKMLGSLVKNALSGGRGRGRTRKRRGSSGASSVFGVKKSALAMGALGTAIAAFEHFSGKDTDQIGRGSAGQGAPPGTPTTPPPATTAAPLPPLPPVPGAAAPPAPPQGLPPLPPAPGSPPAVQETPPTTDSGSEEALLLIQAMIAAAHADHDFDDDERATILKAVEESGVSGDDRAFLLGELDHPKSLTALAAKATSPDLARQVYLASLMAIVVDTEAEESYMAKLAERLGLSQSDVDELEGMLDE